MASGTYWALTRLFPQPNMRDTWSEPKGLWIPPECQTGAGSEVEDTVSDDKEKDGGLATADVIEAPRYELQA